MDALLLFFLSRIEKGFFMSSSVENAFIDLKLKGPSMFFTVHISCLDNLNIMEKVSSKIIDFEGKTQQ